MVDEMPKDGINMVEGSSHITEMQKFDQIEYSHNPFYFILECSFFYEKDFVFDSYFFKGCNENNFFE